MSELQGLLVAGATPGCGKTVIATGLAASLKELGMPSVAIKPLTFSPIPAVRPASDPQFMDAVLRPLHTEESLAVPSPYEVSNIQWNRLLEGCRQLVWPALIECPGAVSTPWKFVGEDPVDVADMSRLLGIPVLLVVRKSPALLTDAALAMTYLSDRGTPAVGWVAVETAPEAVPHWEAEVQYLHGHYGVPFWGEVAYSPSISVLSLQQGNLIRSVEGGIDLLPVQQALASGMTP